MVEYRSPESIRSVAVLGSGTVGESWTALFLAHDIDVVAFDPAENAPERTRAFVTNAWPALVALGVARKEMPRLSNLIVADKKTEEREQAHADAVGDAQF
jgi:carnitine 3-dehydrogenase